MHTLDFKTNIYYYCLCAYFGAKYISDICYIKCNDSALYTPILVMCHFCLVGSLYNFIISSGGNIKRLMAASGRILAEIFLCHNKGWERVRVTQWLGVVLSYCSGADTPHFSVHYNCNWQMHIKMPYKLCYWIIL